MARPRSDIKPRVLRAARARFLAEGVDGASLRAIAADAETSIGMIHYYFASKDELFLAVVEEVYAKLLADLENALAGEGATRDRLRRASARIGAATDEELDVVRLVVREALVSSARLDRVIERFKRGHIALVMGAIAEGVANGELDGEVPLPVLVMMSGAMLVVPQIIRRVAGTRLPFAGTLDGDALATIVIDRLFRGIEPKEAVSEKKPARRRR